MSRQLRSNNPVLYPAVCSISPQELADLEETELLFVIVNVKNRLESDGFKADVRVVMTSDEPPVCQLVGTVSA
jgi:hypothetical protein